MAVALVAATAGCGSGEDSEARIARERADAARLAVQGERIKNLEKTIDGTPTTTTATTTTVVTGPEPPSGPAPEAGSGPSSSASDWPGGTGYTAILASLGSRTAAKAAQRRFAGRGLDAGVLNSSDYSSLRPGYWVVFSGTFPSKSGADQRASRARSLGVKGAYARFVAP